MIYGLTRDAFIEDGPAVTAMDVQARRTTARSWRILNAELRLQLIERALKPANDVVDAYPLAL
jgi:hypothetical protein